MSLPPSSALLLSCPEEASWNLFSELCRGLLTKKENVYAYLLHHGVRFLAKPGMADLQALGLHLQVCSLAAEKHHIPFTDQATFSGLGSLASLIQHTETFHSFSCFQPTLPQSGPHHSVQITASEPLDHPDGNTLESLRVAAGLTQLSDLKIHLRLEKEASLFLEAPNRDGDESREAQTFLQLIKEGGGTFSTYFSPDKKALELRIG